MNVNTSNVKYCEANSNDSGMVSSLSIVRRQRIVPFATASKEKRKIVKQMKSNDWSLLEKYNKCKHKYQIRAIFHTIGDSIGYQASKKKYNKI